MIHVDVQIMPLFLACLDGFIGEECKTPCPYPTYGKNCDFSCDCKEEYCNVSMGCLQGKLFKKNWIRCVRKNLIFLMIDSVHWEKEDNDYECQFLSALQWFIIFTSNMNLSFQFIYVI